MDPFDQWRQQAERAIKKRGIDPNDVEPDAYWQAFQAGDSPMLFAAAAQQHVMLPHRKQQVISQAVYTTNTGIGLCPQCQSPNVVQFDNIVKDTNAKVAYEASGCALGCIGCISTALLVLIIGIPLMILGVVLFVIGLCVPGQKTVGTSRQCRYCNNRWQV